MKKRVLFFLACICHAVYSEASCITDALNASVNGLVDFGYYPAPGSASFRFNATTDRFVFTGASGTYTFSLSTASSSVNLLYFSINGNPSSSTPQSVYLTNGAPINFYVDLQPSMGSECLSFTLDMELKSNGVLYCSEELEIFLKPCASGGNIWREREVVAHRNSPPALATRNGIIHTGNEQVFYMAGYSKTGGSLFTHQTMYNTYGSNVWEHQYAQDFFGNKQALGASNIVIYQGDFYVIGNDRKVYYTFWDNQQRYVYYLLNNNAITRWDSHLQIAPDGKVFYISSTGDVSNIFGSTWQYGPLNSSAPKAVENSDIVIGDNDRIYYADVNQKIRVFSWAGSQWVSSIANTFATNYKVGTEMVFGDGKLFYVGIDNKIHVIGGASSTDHYVLNASSPNAESSLARTGMDYKNGVLVYVTSDFHLTSYTYNSSLAQWMPWQIGQGPEACISIKQGSAIDYSNYAERVYYINSEDGKLHYIEPGQCSTYILTKASSLEAEQSTSNAEMEVYPNPSAEVLYIKAKEGFRYEIVNTKFELVKKGAVEAGPSTAIDLRSLNDGVYILKWINNSGEVGYKKFVKV